MVLEVPPTDAAPYVVCGAVGNKPGPALLLPLLMFAERGTLRPKAVPEISPGSSVTDPEGACTVLVDAAAATDAGLVLPDGVPTLMRLRDGLDL